jgi:hypothetical protein
LSDPKGILGKQDFETIVDRCYHKGVHYSTISLELYLNQNKELLENIVHQSLDRGIREFNVTLNHPSSTFQTSQKIPSTITYEDFYEFLVKYILLKIENQIIHEK